MKMHFAQSKPTDEWRTPEVLVKAIEYVTDLEFGLDPCASAGNVKCEYYFDQSINGLLKPWDGYGDVFWNPPYSNIPAWCEKANQEWVDSQVMSVGLLRSDTSTKWFHNYLGKTCKVILLKPRVRFLTPPGVKDSTSNVFGSVLFVFGSVEKTLTFGQGRVSTWDWKQWAMENHKDGLWKDYVDRVR